MPAFGSDTPFWLDRPTDPPEPPFRGEAKADVVIVGGGFTGLWTAIQLKETAPDLRVIVLEQEVVGFGASGRNGGFVDASLTHGLANGLKHFPDEIDALQAEGARNYSELTAFVRSEGIECDLEENGFTTLATEPYQVREFEAWLPIAARHGEASELWDRQRAQGEIHSPLIVGALHHPEGVALVDPGKLVRGLKRAALTRGVRIHEGSRVAGLERADSGVRVRVAGASGSIAAGRVVVATSAYSGWLRRLLTWFVPVYDYVLASEPLTPEQRAAVGWERRQGLEDATTRFHYFRLTADDRILWGGWDAIYHWRNGVGPRHDARPATFDLLDRQFRAFFPQLADLHWTHRWGGAIDTTSNFTVTFGNLMGGRVLYALGYTGLGVAASRWAGGVVRDMLLRPESDLLRLRFVRAKPWPIPPEPLRSLGVAVMQREIARADDHEGRKGLLLRFLETLGIGFDS
jgi:glycine/D-amino acid oxidase-like deaminating enzyme